MYAFNINNVCRYVGVQVCSGGIEMESTGIGLELKG
jgi:hypothetical protein